MKDVVKKYVGIKVKALREKNALSQEALAEVCEVSWRTISNLERGVVVPDLRVLMAISKHFNIGLDQFFEFDVQEHKDIQRLLAEAILFIKIKETDAKTFNYIQENVDLILKYCK